MITGQLWGDGHCPVHVSATLQFLRMENGVNINVAVDCRPEDAGRFLGIPDAIQANQAYLEAMTGAMAGRMGGGAPSKKD